MQNTKNLILMNYKLKKKKKTNKQTNKQKQKPITYTQ